MAIGRFVSPGAKAEFVRIYRTAMARLPEPTATRDVPTRFGSVRVYRFGSATTTPFVLLPGRAGTSVMWLPNLPGLAEHHPVYTVEPLGEAGLSDQTVPLPTAADQASWLDETLAALGLDGVHLVGHSFGGWLAANLAVRRPGRLASLSLFDPVYTFGRVGPQLLVRATLAVLPVVSRWGRPAFETWINGGVPAPKDDPIAAVIDAGMRNYRTAVGMPEYPTDDQLRSIGVPTLALIAGRSVIHRPEAAYDRARALVPNIRAELWPDATHSLPVESPADTNDRLLRFLAGVPA